MSQKEIKDWIIAQVIPVIKNPILATRHNLCNTVDSHFVHRCRPSYQLQCSIGSSSPTSPSFLFPTCCDISFSLSSLSSVHSTISHSTVVLPSPLRLVPLIFFILPNLLPSIIVSNQGSPPLASPFPPLTPITPFSINSLSFSASSMASFGSKPNSSKSRKSEPAREP